MCRFLTQVYFHKTRSPQSEIFADRSLQYPEVGDGGISQDSTRCSSTLETERRHLHKDTCLQTQIRTDRYLRKLFDAVLLEVDPLESGKEPELERKRTQLVARCVQLT